MKTRSERFGGAGRAVAIALLAGTTMGLGAAAALAGPEGANVVRGDVRFQRQGDVTSITASHNSIINYRTFNIDAHETVRFIQPNAQARVLNRVRGAEPSRIEGALLANGRVYLVNPAGVIFGSSAIVDARGIYAAAADLTNSDFLRGVDHFRNVRGDVTIRGLISAEAVHVVGRRIANHGTIVADRGVVTMSVGGDVLIGERGGSVYVRIDGANLAEADPGATAPDGARVLPASEAGAAIENAGEVRAAGGQIRLGAGDAVSLAIRNTGRVVASGGEARLEGAGAIENAGEVDASVAAGDAGGVVIRGSRIEHTGIARADSDAGRAGSVEIVSRDRTLLGSGSIVSAAGGSGAASGGEILVHAPSGVTRFEEGAFVDLSGGALGGDAGFAEISAGVSLHAAGLFDATAPRGRLGTVLFDPRDIVIRDGSSALIGPDEFINVSVVETPGNVILEADRNLFVTTDIFKPSGTGSLTLRAGLDPGNGQGDIVLGEYPFGFIPGDLSIQADSLVFDARRDILNNVALGANLFASLSGISLTARTGSIAVNRVETLTPGNNISWTQAESLAFSAAPGGVFPNAANATFEVRVTDGFLRLGGDVDATQTFGALGASASDGIMVEDPIVSAGPVSLEAGLDGVGDITFVDPGASIAADMILLQAGNQIGSTARVDVVTNSPRFFGSGGAGTRPDSLFIRQDASIGASDLADASQFGAALSGMNYELTSFSGSIGIGTASDVNGTALALSSSAGSTVAAPLSLQELTVFGPVNLNADVTTTEDQDYNGLATLTGVRTLTGDEIAFDGGAAGDSLTVNGMLTGSSVNLSGDADLEEVNLFGDLFVGGDANLNGIVMASSVEIGGGTTLDASSVETTGDQTYTGGLMLAQDASLTSGGGIDLADVDGAHALQIDADGLTTFSGPVGQMAPLASLGVSGEAFIETGSIATDGGQTWGGDVTLAMDTTLTGGSIVFQMDVDGASQGGASLTLDGPATVGGGVGQTMALSSFTATDSLALNGPGVATTGGQFYTGDVALGADATLRSLNDGTIRFASDIDGPFDLSVVTGEDGLIVFEGDVGQSDPLITLSLRTDGGDGERPIPMRATIVGDPDDGVFSVNVGVFEMGQNEKATILGGFDLNAATSAALSDVVAVDDLLVTSPSITLLRRQAGEILTSDGTLVSDRGLDFVAGGNLELDGVITLGGESGAPDPTFSNVAGASSTIGITPFDLTEIDADRTSREALTFEDLVLDQRSAEGDGPPPPPDDVEVTLIDQAPQDPQLQDSVQPAVYDLGVLAQIGVQARAVTPAEAQTFVRRTIYADLPPTPEQFPRVEALAATRFNLQAAQRVAQTYESVLGGEQAEQVAQAINASVQRYMTLAEAGAFRANAYRVYLETEPQEAEALAYVERLQGLLASLRDLGLTRPEYVETRNRLMAALVTPDSPASAADLGEAIEASPGAAARPAEMSDDDRAGGAARGASVGE